MVKTLFYHREHREPRSIFLCVAPCISVVSFLFSTRNTKGFTKDTTHALGIISKKGRGDETHAGYVLTKKGELLSLSFLLVDPPGLEPGLF